MNLIVTIPDDLADRLTMPGADLGRQALEAVALEAFHAGRITHYELRQVLGFETRFELDAFLKERMVFEPVTLEDVRHDLADLNAFG